MAGTVLYRKWRPRRFADIVGQDPIVRTLKNAIRQGKTSHAYLFSGPRGTGKTSTGRILAKAINVDCDADGEPLLDSEAAKLFENSLDLIEIDAASNRGIDDIRELRERANYAPGSSRFKVYLIDEVHQLTTAAADALLKTLEEPPPHVVFILATTDPQQLKSTILSRCQRFDFRRIGVEVLVGHLRTIAEAEGITISDEALNLIAREATGSARDAVNLLDRVWATEGDEVTTEGAVEALGLTADKRALELARAALQKDLPAGLAVLIAVQDDAVDLGRFKRQVVQHLRHALLTQTNATETLALSEPEQEALADLVKGVDPAATISALRAINDADIQADPFDSLPLELALGRLAYEEELRPAAPAAPAKESRAPSRRGQQSGRPGAQRSASQGRRTQPPPARADSRPRSPDPTRAAPTEAKPAPPPREKTAQEQLMFDIRQALKQRGEHKLVGVLNGSCDFQDLDAGDELVLAFRPAYLVFHKPHTEEHIEILNEVTSAVLGRTITIRCIEGEATEPARSSLVAEAEKLGARRVGAANPDV
ncbi:MAG: DNA polymerase III subunit gamma/tau [Chloroflexi bacterium]|nr:DNA polymerase III subunit gamma/tau [Chloroflexota bacterium]